MIRFGPAGRSRRIMRSPSMAGAGRGQLAMPRSADRQLLQLWISTARCAPNRKYNDELPDLVDFKIDVVPGLGHEHPANNLPTLGGVLDPSAPSSQEHRPSLGELARKEVTRGRTLLTPPGVHLGHLELGLRGKEKHHPRAKSLRITSSPSTSCPARACSKLRSREASRRARSSGENSSCSTSVNSISAPSGKSVGSSSTTCPPLMCAFKARISMNITVFVPFRPSVVRSRPCSSPFLLVLPGLSPPPPETRSPHP